MHRYARRFGLASCVAALIALVGASTAPATIVTVGSPLSAAFSPATVGSGRVTFINSALPEAGANVTSPVTGTIIRWRITGASGGPFYLRVLSHGSGNTYTGAGTSTPQTPTGTGTQTFPTNLPISAGQTIGFDSTNSSDTVGAAAVTGASYTFWFPALGDGETRAGTGPSSGTELGFNADVATQPSNADTLGALKRNKHKGTATLSVNVPGPGTLALSGKGVKTQRPAARAVASKAVTAAGTVKLLIKAKGKKKRKLNDTGKVKVKVNVTYTPSGDLPGVPNTQTKRVKLIKKLG